MPCSSGCCGPPPEPESSPVPALSHRSNGDAGNSRDSAIQPLTCNPSNLDCPEKESDDVGEARDVCTEEQKDDCCSTASNAEEQEADKESCGQSCCAASIDTEEPKDCCSASRTGLGECCDARTEVEKDNSAQRCCAPSKTLKSESRCVTTTSKQSESWGGVKRSNDTCRQNDKEATINDSSRPVEAATPCCEGKPSPCCDKTCVERLALRECKRGKPTATISSGATTITECSRGKGEKACSEHDRTAREYYQAKLDALGCICRALLALGQESCCVSSGSATTQRNRGAKKASTSFVPGDLCCAGTGNKESISSATRRKVSVKVSSKGCCPRSIREEKDECRAACCTNSPADGIAASCTGACCGKANQAREKEGLKTPVVDSIGAVDIERGPSGNEHIILSISGMTCTGCETKLTRTLGTLQSVTNLKTSLVLARAQFDLDTSKTSVADVTRHLERTTEFKCERITNRGSSINLIRTGSSEEVANGIWPLGVINVAPIGKDTIRVDYDAKVVGARDLVEKGWKQPLQLAPPAGDPSLETGSKHVRRVGYMTLLSAVLTVPVLVLAWAPLPDSEVAYSSASLALATIIQVVIAGPFYPKAMKALIFSRVIEMDLLIVLSTSAAYVFSVVSFGYLLSGHPLSTGEFFETGTLLVTLIMVGRYVAALARQKAVESISIRSLQTSTATLIEKSGVEKDIDSRLLQYGDVFKTLPECRITTDGTVVSGTSEVNESMITGESKPVEKGPGSSVVAGSINGSGVLHIRLTRLPEDNTISTIAAMVDEAKLSKPKIQDIADRVASYFVPVVVVLAVITFVAWVGLGINVRGISGSEATIQAITYAITVLIVSCPCAIGLAVPMVIVIATGIAADRGVIFKTAESIEEAYKTTDVVFDKTGTLTEGKLSVEVVEYVSNDELSDDIESLLLGLLDSNKHPVSVAVAAHLKTKGVAPSPVFGHKSLPAKGVEGTTPAGQVLRAGNSTWLNLSAHPRVQALASQRFTVLCFTINDRLAAIMGLSDSLRSDAVSTVSKLQAAGIGTHILSGDDDGAVKDVAAQLNIPARNIRSRCTPADKRDYVQALVSQGSTPNQSRISLDKRQKRPIVLFIGDGTNDAVALATATIGVHINTSGTDVARSAADVVLVRPRLTSCLTVIGVSKVAIRRIAFNFGWSFVYNLFAVLLAAGAFTRLDARIPPQYAGLGELVSVLPVIGAAVTMRLAKV